jgi:hypothetical protein
MHPRVSPVEAVTTNCSTIKYRWQISQEVSCNTLQARRAPAGLGPCTVKSLKIITGIANIEPLEAHQFCDRYQGCRRQPGLFFAYFTGWKKRLMMKDVTAKLFWYTAPRCLPARRLETSDTRNAVLDIRELGRRCNSRPMTEHGGELSFLPRHQPLGPVAHGPAVDLRSQQDAL